MELHDCFSCNELITYEALGLCAPGTASQLVDSGNNTYGGKYVVNPSGGLISKGHPLGATGEFLRNVTVLREVDKGGTMRNRRPMLLKFEIYPEDAH